MNITPSGNWHQILWSVIIDWTGLICSPSCYSKKNRISNPLLQSFWSMCYHYRSRSGEETSQLYSTEEERRSDFEKLSAAGDASRQRGDSSCNILFICICRQRTSAQKPEDFYFDLNPHRSIGETEDLVSWTRRIKMDFGRIRWKEESCVPVPWTSCIIDQ